MCVCVCVYIYIYIYSLHLFPIGLEPIITHAVCIEHSVCQVKEWPRCITLPIIFLNSQQHPSLILLVVATFLNKYFLVQFIFRQHFCKKQAAATSFSLPSVISQPLSSPPPPSSTKIQTHPLPNTHTPLKPLVTR